MPERYRFASLIDGRPKKYSLSEQLLMNTVKAISYLTAVTPNKFVYL
jgi:hypothetical protein